MKKRQQNTHSLRTLVVSIFLCALALLIASSGVLLLKYYTSEQLYQESVYQLEELSAQLFEKLGVQIDIQWDYLEKLSSVLKEQESITGENLRAVLDHMEKDLAPCGRKIYLRVITDDGSYYTDEGKQGIWTGYDSLTGSERQSFLLSNWLDDQVYMAFSLRVDEPFTVDGHKVGYLVLLRTMSDMQPFFHSSAFESRNVAYIINYDGFVLASDGSLKGIDFMGKNIYRSMENQVYPHYGSFSAVLDKGNPSGTVCTDVIVGGSRFYLVYDRLPFYDWAVLLLMSADDVAVNASVMVSSLLALFILIIFIIVVLAIVIFVFIFRIQHGRKMLSIEETAREKLEIEQKKTQAALTVAENATRAKSQFLSNMSHDIRTPMNAIMGVTTLMEHEVDNPQNLRYYIHKLRQSGSYMLGLINDVLDMSKIESGDVHLNPESLKLAEQVGQAESIIRSQCSEKGQEFTVSVHEIRHEYLIGDNIRLRQILLNILTNAVKYTQAGGRISFEIRELSNADPGKATLFFSVTDNGHGMSAGFLKNIFKPFCREVNSTTNRIQGTGLGMSITKSLVDLMHGQIDVESEEGKGSRFDVTLTMPVDGSASYMTEAKSVLLVSREEALIENVKAALSPSSLVLTVASCSEEALSVLSERKIDIVILSGNGTPDNLKETVRKLRERHSDAVIIYCSESESMGSMRENLGTIGLDGLMKRPFFFDNLAVAVKSAREDKKEHETKKAVSALSGKRFLCAEDNSLNAEILEALLSMHGASCTICSDGVKIVEAFGKVKEGDYDAILMDVQMPNMNGLDATRAIRSGENVLGRTIPIIAMTANAFSSDVAECTEAGMDAHVAKPIDMTVLERTVSELLRRGNAETAAEEREKSIFS